MLLDDEEFTFAAVPPSSVRGGRFGAHALYPVFGKPRSPPRPRPPETTAAVRVPLAQLLLADKEPSPRDDELDSVPAEMYCPWTPGLSPASPVRCRKSGSTGSSFLRWRPTRLVGRSQSDGKEKFVFLNTRAAASASGSSSRRRKRIRNGEPGGGGGGHAWSYYANNGSGSGGARRTSFLPYKQDLVGLFANTAVFRRSYLPF